VRLLQALNAQYPGSKFGKPAASQLIPTLVAIFLINQFNCIRPADKAAVRV
jgi:hypothetical protein